MIVRVRDCTGCRLSRSRRAPPRPSPTSSHRRERHCAVEEQGMEANKVRNTGPVSRVETSRHDSRDDAHGGRGRKQRDGLASGRLVAEPAPRPPGGSSPSSLRWRRASAVPGRSCSTGPSRPASHRRTSASPWSMPGMARRDGADDLIVELVACPAGSIDGPGPYLRHGFARPGACVGRTGCGCTRTAR